MHSNLNSFIITCYMMFFASNICAQELHDFNIYFKKNVNEISWNGQHKVDSVVALLPAKLKFYSVEISGYSDGVGSKKYNQKLSKRRSEKVADYFLKIGFPEEKVSYKGAGMIEELSGEGNPKNRKVNIRIFLSLPELKPLNEITESIEHFTIENAFGGNIKTKSGTVLFIPSETFMDIDSNMVLGNVEIEYKEYRTPDEFLGRGLHFNDEKLLRIFHSAGMFEIKAFENGKEVYINPKRRISVLFGLNKRTILLDLYHKSDTIVDGQFIRYLTDDKGIVSNTRNYGPSCGGLRELGFCHNLGSCERLQHLVNTGLDYAESEISVVEQFKKLDSIHVLEMLPLTNEKERIELIMRGLQENYNKAMDSVQAVGNVAYKIERIRSTRNKWVFQIESDLKQFNEMEPLKGVGIVYRGAIPDSVFQVIWDNCKIVLNKRKRGTLILKINNKKYRMKNIRCKSSMLSENKKEPYELYKEYRKILKVRLKEVERRKTICDSLGREIDLMENELDSINSEIEKVRLIYRDLNILEFQCFWELSEPYMSKEESELDYRGWIEYFEKNKSEMVLRYTNIKNNNIERFERCNEMAKERVLIYQKVTAVNNIKHSESEERDTVIIPLLINKLGVYNTARKYTSYTNESPVFINKTKTNILKYQLDSAEVDVSCLLIIPNHLNGYYKYDGSYNYSPYHFPKALISNDSSLLIGYDNNGKPYYTLISTNEIKENAVLNLKPFKSISQFDFLSTY